MAVAEGFEPYSATWSEHRKTGDLQKTMTAVHGSYPLVIRICVQRAAKEGFGWLSDADRSALCQAAGCSGCLSRACRARWRPGS